MYLHTGKQRNQIITDNLNMSWQLASLVVFDYNKFSYCNYAIRIIN